MLRIQIVSLLIIGLTALAQSPLDSARQKFQSELEEVDKTYTLPESTRLLTSAKERLGKLLLGFQAKGDFQSIKQVQAEQKRLETSGTVNAADLVAGPAPLRQVQEQFRAAAEAISRETVRRKTAVQQRYHAGLIGYQQKVTKAGDFKTAEAIEGELKRIGKLETGGAAKTAAAPAPTPTPTGGAHLGNGFYEFRGHVYRLMGHESESFNGAKTRAAALGGQLACLETEAELQFVRGLVGFANTFVGLEDLDGTYRWVNGKALAYNGVWAPGHPTSGNAIFLAPNGRLERRVASTGRLINVEIRGVPRASFIVEWPSRAASAGALKTLQAEVARMRRRGKSFNGHTYTLITTGMHPREAMDYCRSLGGTMAVPESQAEQEFLTRDLKERIWLGITDEANEGDWRTQNGQKPSFTAWSPGEPNNLDGLEHHAGVLVDRGPGFPWFDATHNHGKYPFFCRW